MPSPEQITDAVTSYVKAVASGTGQEIAALYAEDATLEDPVGSEPRRGRAAIAEFYTAVEAAQRHTELRTLRVAGDEAAFQFLIRAEQAGQAVELEPIDVMTFDADGLITGMRAFWSPADLRVVS